MSCASPNKWYNNITITLKGVCNFFDGSLLGGGGFWIILPQICMSTLRHEHAMDGGGDEKCPCVWGWAKTHTRWGHEHFYHHRIFPPSPGIIVDNFLSCNGQDGYHCINQCVVDEEQWDMILVKETYTCVQMSALSMN